LYFEKLNKK